MRLSPLFTPASQLTPFIISARLALTFLIISAIPRLLSSNMHCPSQDDQSGVANSYREAIFSSTMPIKPILSLV
ncbi:hypothetical protein HNR37_002084 [Desulfurispira natronophila]|uniref:Uncharacterized protein n=1 Tax=Desulfurispira natronophila TaxID=682562 RepID=A0A7W8DHN3_9BACT|nr:hypothetical protein [Desulfurispira natronophila]